MTAGNSAYERIQSFTMICVISHGHYQPYNDPDPLVTDTEKLIWSPWYFFLLDTLLIYRNHPYGLHKQYNFCSFFHLHFLCRHFNCMDFVSSLFIITFIQDMQFTNNASIYFLLQSYVTLLRNIVISYATHSVFN